jgi:PAS domain S-box-containing protein
MRAVSLRGRGTPGFLEARRKGLRELTWRFASRWVGLALLLELVLATIDLASGTSVLTSSYLVPVLAVAVVESAERTALVAAVAIALALISGALQGDLFTSAHIYRLGIVAGGGCLGVVGAAFRARAVQARDRMELLAKVGEVADGTSALDETLSRLAAILVPAAADMCEIVVIEDETAHRVASHSHGLDRGVAAAMLARPVELCDGVLRAVKSDEAVLVRHLRHGDAPKGADVDALRGAGMTSAVYAPMRAAEETLAVLVLAVGHSGRRYGSEDMRFATTVGSRAALAIRNAGLLAELRDAQQRMEAIVGSLADAVTIREPSGNLIYANDAALRSMGLASVQELQAREPEALFNEFIVTDERGDPLSMSDLPSVKLLAGEQPEPLLLRFVSEDTGQERWSLLKTTPLYDARGRLEAAVTIIEDVTASKRAELQSSFLSRASAILASSLDYEETLGNVAWLAVPEIADWCVVDLLDAHGERQQVVAAHRDAARVEVARRLRELRSADPDTALGVALRTGRPQLIPEVPLAMLERAAHSEEHLELLRSLRIRSGIVVPMSGANRIIGAMTLVNAESGRAFSEADVSFAEQIAARAAVAVENARLYSERTRIATTLQRSLLPEALPEITGWELASLYRPASSDGGVEVGGDFYDAFETATGWLMLIGDVTGKGVEAAAMTSLVRHGARFISDHTSDPAEILERLDRSLRQQPALSLCTALCLHIEGSRVVFASAGHPLPLLVTDDGVRPVGQAGSVLGAFEDGDWPTLEVELHPHEVLLLYTDGVTDTVGEAERFGEQRLSVTIDACGPQPPADLLQCLDQALSEFQVGDQADDTAALALRLVGRPEPAGLSAGVRGAEG